MTRKTRKASKARLAPRVKARTVRSKSAKPAKSTALVKRSGAATLATTLEDAAIDEPSGLPMARTVTDGITIGELGLVPVKLTKRETALIAAPIPTASIQILPTGYPYIPHGYVIQLFNRAFGHGAWSLVPVSRPSLIDQGRAKLVSRGYVLHVHGKPTIFAEGEQAYWPGNQEQTYGDALEATRGSALKRCAKHLGIGVELMDPVIWRPWRDAHAVKVTCKTRVKTDQGWTDGEPKTQWRLKTADPLPGEVGRGAPVERDRPVASHPDDERPITKGTPDRPGQIERLWALMKKAGRPETELRMWLKVRFNIDSTAAIRRCDYEYICKCISASGPLPLDGAAALEGELVDESVADRGR
jgi:hypothetical protein